MVTHIFIQARMSSLRYPGKVLAPIRGKPLIKHLIDRSRSIQNVDKVVVLTSTETSDDPLVAYLDSISCAHFRGNLQHVFERFQNALSNYSCDYFIRLCADSPCIDTQLIQFMLNQIENNDYDIISNVINRSFPKGQSVEVIKCKTFLSIDKALLTSEEEEHLTLYFYNHKNLFKLLSIENSIDQSAINTAVDTIEDFRNIHHNETPYTFHRDTVCTIEY